MISLLAMVEQEFEDFDKESQKHKGLKTLIDFDTNIEGYEGATFEIKAEPKFKKKLKASVYIKTDNSKGQLF